MAMATLTAEELDDLQSFLKDWLRHAGRTQADLRRSLRAASVRMPVLVDALHRTYSRGGLGELVAQLCAIEAEWHGEDQAAVLTQLGDGTAVPAPLVGSLEQLDLLLQEIRQEQA
ncbi:MAG: hypothetical protein VKM98_08560 [Cyanobacteriota bacterium]|nr:hypothetical protein [Cyanobacteriota bacterium]